MGVCTEERPVMHWQQSARFLGPPTERSPNYPNILNIQCTSNGNGTNNNQTTFRSCTSCVESCEHRKTPGMNQMYQNYDSRDKIGFEESLYYSELNKQQCHDSNDINNPLMLKTEPIRPSSSESANDSIETDDCSGCGKMIQDRFYLSAVEKRWHVGCLQCCICRLPLEDSTSCFFRDRNIYCKTDYYRVFGARRCSKCLDSISSTELVLRARHLVYHVRCFSCTVCNTPLNKGDHFGIRDSSIFCRLHYQIPIESTSPMNFQLSSQFGLSSNTPSSPVDGNNKICSNVFFSQHNITGLSQQPRQKGRPRKRKPKDIEALTANLDLNSDYLDLGFSRGGMSSSSRTKRMRTSFKHHQLRTMKSYFAINHNPDAKDLKQLSQKTGLPKRVLQVWFQNARAKWRRMMMKQEGKSVDNDKCEDLDSYDPGSPSYMLDGSTSPSSALD